MDAQSLKSVQKLAVGVGAKHMGDGGNRRGEAFMGIKVKVTQQCCTLPGLRMDTHTAHQLEARHHGGRNAQRSSDGLTDWEKSEERACRWTGDSVQRQNTQRLCREEKGSGVKR